MLHWNLSCPDHHIPPCCQTQWLLFSFFPFHFHHVLISISDTTDHSFLFSLGFWDITHSWFSSYGTHFLSRKFILLTFIHWRALGLHLFSVHSCVISFYPLTLDQVYTLVDLIILSPAQTSLLRAHSQTQCSFARNICMPNISDEPLELNLPKLRTLPFTPISPYPICFFLGLLHFPQWSQLFRWDTWILDSSLHSPHSVHQ